MRIYAIGDIHGHRDLLEAAHARIAADQAREGGPASCVVHIGDLCDRGPDTRGVIEMLMAGIAGGAPWVVLKGNHDRMFSYYLEAPTRADPCLRPDLTWLHPRLGGATTLASYGVIGVQDDGARDDGGPGDGGRGAALHAEARAAVPQAHRDWLAARPAWHLAGPVLFVHAGVRPGVDLRAQTEDDLTWIRAPFLEDTRDHGALVVHGHTAIEEATHYGNRLNIDSSAAYGGPLTAVVIEADGVWRLGERGREPIARTRAPLPLPRS